MNSFKKISITIAAALAIGSLSALPTNAAVNAATLAIDSATDTVTTGESATAVVTLSFVAQASADTATIISAMYGQPSGAAKSATLSLIETSSASVAIAGNNVSADVNSTVNTPTYVTAKFLVTLNAPSVAGTYDARIMTTTPINGPSVSWTVTVKAADVTPSASTTTSILNKGEVTTATADDAVYAPKITSTDAAAIIVVTPKNAAGGSATESILATVTGSGLIGTGSNATSIAAQGRALVIPSGNYIGVFADGTAGVSTITLTTLTGTVIAIEKVTFYGDIVSIVATPVKSVIATGANTSVVTAVAYDAAGVTVGAGTLNAYSSDVSVVSDSGTAATIVNGVATFTLTGVKTGGVAITVKSGTIASAPVSTRVEGSVITVKLSFDKAEYLPGEAAKITVTPVDASGLPLSAKTYSNLFATGGIVPSYAFGSGSDVITGISVTTDTSTVKTFKVFMPMTETNVTIIATGGSSLPVAGQVAVSATAKVTNKVSDAANQAAKAAGDAVLAAGAATKAADAATAKAQEAVTAVATLSAQVAVLVASLKKQLTSLTSLVLKIQKKVKA